MRAKESRAPLRGTPPEALSYCLQASPLLVEAMSSEAGVGLPTDAVPLPGAMQTSPEGSVQALLAATTAFWEATDWPTTVKPTLLNGATTSGLQKGGGPGDRLKATLSAPAAVGEP